MEAHQVRVVEEKRELDSKIKSLSAFGLSSVFDELPDDEQGRMNNQLSIMEDYSEVLGQRIAFF